MKMAALLPTMYATARAIVWKWPERTAKKTVNVPPAFTVTTLIINVWLLAIWGRNANWITIV